MRSLRFAAVASLSVTIMSCSGGSDLPQFTTEGVTAPAASRQVDPRSFATAEYLGDYGKGICTVKGAYRITTVAGVRLSQPAIVNCAVANGFHQWLTDVVVPAAAKARMGRVTDVQVAASYACRPRNGRRGAKLSEHGFGNAIDVSGFGFSDGKSLSVEGDYYSSEFLKRVRTAACGIFRTVLGPGSDRSHRDHLHYDLATRRSGQNYCH